ncbi:MAG: hypothetical protein ACTSSP_04490 [Candidatus Asgardarchaeia archaeon]
MDAYSERYMAAPKPIGAAKIAVPLNNRKVPIIVSNRPPFQYASKDGFPRNDVNPANYQYANHIR